MRILQRFLYGRFLFSFFLYIIRKIIIYSWTVDVDEQTIAFIENKFYT